MFFNEEDRLVYLEWLRNYCQKWAGEVISYCLMTLHIHLILRPSTEDGLQMVLKPLHMRYAQCVNKANGGKGHLWQGRFFSSPLDEIHT
ncbi:MAG: transposase [Sedimenticola sp.]